MDGPATQSSRLEGSQPSETNRSDIAPVTRLEEIRYKRTCNFLNTFCMACLPTFTIKIQQQKVNILRLNNYICRSTYLHLHLGIQ